MSIYIGNLSYEVTKEDLDEVFREYGIIKHIHRPIVKRSDSRDLLLWK